MLSKHNTGLIVVDIQGNLAKQVHASSAFLDQCATLIQGAKCLDLPVVVLEQLPNKLGPTDAKLAAHLGAFTPIIKSTFNACEEPEFVERVQSFKVDTWLVCGIEAHICVYQTVLGLLDLDYHVELVSDCVSSRKLSNAELGIHRAEASGASVTSVEMCLYELVKDASSPEFLPILNLIR